MNIIAADDENAALHVLCSAIREAVPDAVVFGFHSPTQALQFARQTRCDIAFLDIKMFEMNGIELAKRLKKVNPRINIIFVTGYSEYTGEAISMRASGYLQKPVMAEDVLEEINNLRYPVQQPARGIYAQTFGNFELFVDGKPVPFPRAKSKELLAYLIDRHGAGVTRKEIAGILFEDREYDRSTQDYLNHIITDMVGALRAVNAERILVKGRNYLAVDTGAFACDLYEYEKGNAQSLNTFKGEYMVQYSWAEETEAMLYD